MTEQMKGTKSPMNTGAFKRVFGVLVVLLLASALMIGAVSAADIPANAVAKHTVNGADIYYTHLVDAVANASKSENASSTVTLLKNVPDGCGIITGDGAKFTLDLDGYTYTVSGTPLAGSEGTKSQAFQLKSKHDITIKNGTLTSTSGSGVCYIIQNYGNLTLDNVTLDGTNLDQGKSVSTGNPVKNYVLSNNNGEIRLKNGVTIIAPEKSDKLVYDGVAFDVYDSTSYTGGVSVTIETDDVIIVGSIEIEGSDAALYIPQTYKLTAPVGYSWKKVDSAEQMILTAEENPEASIGTSNYSTLADAFLAAEDGETVTLLKALESQSTAFTISKNITFDGADKQIAFTSTPAEGAIKITATGDVTLQNLNITATGGNALALINAVETGAEGSETAPNKVVIENSKLTVATAPNGFAVIHAQPATELKVTGSTLTATTTEHHVYGIKFNPSHANAKTITVSEKNTIVLESGNTEGLGSAYGVYVLGNTEKLTATISDNTLVAKSKFRVGLLYYTPPKTNEMITISGNTLSMTGHEVYVQNIMVSKSANADIAINTAIEGNNAVNTNTTGLLYAVGFAQRANAYTEQYTDSLVGKITKDNTFTSLTGYVNHITKNVQDGQKIVQLDTSELEIEGQTIDLQIVSPYGTSIDLVNTTQNKGQFTVTPEGTAVSWSSSNTSVLTIDANGNYNAVTIGSATITAVGPSGAEATLLVTVYKEVVPELPVDDIATTGGTTTIEKGSATSEQVVIDSTAGTVTIKDSTSGVEMTIKGTSVVEVSSAITVSGTTEISVSYSPEPAAVSPEVAEDESAEGTYKTEVSINMVNGTMYLLNTTSEFKEDVVETIKAKHSDAGKYKFVSMFTATGENVSRINANLTETGGVEVTFTVPLDWVKKITHNDLSKLKAFHVSNGNVELLSGTGVVDGTSYKFTVIGNSFSSYVLAADTTAPQNNNNGGSSSSSSGSSTWLPSEPAQQPTETPTEEQPTDKPTDTAPTDIPSTQPTATPASPGFGILAALAGLGAVAVLRRQ